jgi:hypothetical protein
MNQTEFEWGTGGDESKEAWVKRLNDARTELSKHIEAIRVKARAIAKDVTTPVSDFDTLMAIPGIDLPVRKVGTQEPAVPPEPPPASTDPGIIVVPVAPVPEPAPPGTPPPTVRDHRGGGMSVTDPREK